jgi:predicted secreted protein
MSISAQLAQNSKLYIAGTAATPEVITAITAGYPTILAITGHAGVANGDSITCSGFTGADAALLNSLTFTVKNYATGATNDTFAIELNTVGKTITVDGSTTVTPTAWIQVKEVKGIKPSGASASKIDVTDLDSTAKEYRTGLVDNGTFSADIHILETDAGQAAVLAAFAASSVNSYKVVTPAKTRTFNASCLKFPTIPDAAVDGVQTGSAEWVISGTVTVA